MKRWGYWLGLTWIVLSAVYFYVHFAWVFYDANRAAIGNALDGVLP